MRILYYGIAIISILGFSNPAFAQGCVQNSFGQVVCAPPGGGAAVDGLGQVKTGPGQCVRDSLGQVWCSSQQGGGAALNSFGQAVCVGGCVLGK